MEKNPTKKEDVQSLALDTIVGELSTKLSARKGFESQIEAKREEMNQIKQEADSDIQPSLRALVLKLGLFESLPEGAVVTFSYTVPQKEDEPTEETPVEETPGKKE